MDYKQRKAAFTIGARLMMDHLSDLGSKAPLEDQQYLLHIRRHYLEAITEFFTGIWELENLKNELTPTSKPDETALQYKTFLNDCGATAREQEVCLESFHKAVAKEKAQHATAGVNEVFGNAELVSMIVANLRRAGPTEKPN